MDTSPRLHHLPILPGKVEQETKLNLESLIISHFEHLYNTRGQLATAQFNICTVSDFWENVLVHVWELHLKKMRSSDFDF